MSQVDENAAELSSEGAAQIELCLRRFEKAWQRGLRPTIEEYLPSEETERSAVLIELVHIDLEYRLKGDELARVEAYLDRYPELAHDRQTALGLIAAEYELRQRRGPRVTREEYFV